MDELMLIVTEKCNLNCSYCYEKNKGKAVMSKKVAKDAVDFFLEGANPDSRIDLSFHGGEPLLEFELIKYTVEYIKKQLIVKKLDPHFSLTTNGTLVTPKIAEYFSENNFNIKVSLDGKEKTHNFHRKTVDSHNTYSKVIKAAHLLNENKCNLGIRMTVTPETVNEFVDNVQWLREQGFTRIFAVPDSFANWSEKFDKLKESYKILQKYYLESLDSNRFYFAEFDGKFGQYIQGDKPKFCSAGFRHFVVNADGKLYPCAHVMGNSEFCIGSLGEEIYKEKRKDYIEKHLLKNDTCNECSISRFCQGRKCSFTNYISTGYLNVSSEFMCRHEKMLYNIVSDIVEELCRKKDFNIMKMLECIKNNPELIPNDKIRKYIYA